MECYPSKLRVLGLFGLTIVMVAGSWFLAAQPELLARVIGWVGVCFFGLGFIALPIMFFRTGPQIVINDEGIEDRRLKLGVIRWEDVRSLSIGSVSSTKFLCIELTDPEKYLSRMPRWKRALGSMNEKLGFPAISIGFSGLRPGIGEVWKHLAGRNVRLQAHPPLMPESRFVVRLSDAEVACERPGGKVERVSWDDLHKVEIVTTADGPRSPDVFWVLHGTDGGCAIPQGATGDSELLERLQTLPGFDNGAVVEAMTCTSAGRFLCWERAAQR